MKKGRKKKSVPPAVPMHYHSNPEVRVEKADNGFIVHSGDGRKKIAANHEDAFKHVKSELKIG